MLKKAEDLDILGVTFDSQTTFGKPLHSVSLAASQKACRLEEVLTSI